ncbi:MAG: cytochrome c [Acidobacteria bacterium]|nr:cytochrome c [Acidobacteriota bacterium]
MTSRLALSTVVASFLAVSATGQPGTRALTSYTRAQAEAGEETYRDVCASCHRADLGGASDTPALAGKTFLGMWGGRPAAELFAYVNAAMPPAGRKPDADTLVQVVAYILKQNGMPSGLAAFDAKAPGIIAPAAGTR